MRFKPIMTLSLCVLLLPLAACTRIKRGEPIDSVCDRSIKAAQHELDLQRKELDKSRISQVENLLTAARIDQQQEQLAQCSDKAQRALALLGKHNK